LKRANKSATSRPKLFTFGTVHNWMSDLLNGLAFLHENEIVHRNLKPSNLFLVESDGYSLEALLTGESHEKAARLKIGDFCQAFTIASVFAAYRGTESEHYASPEFLHSFLRMDDSNKDCVVWCDPRVDVWSAACVFFEMITLRRAFESRRRTELYHSIGDVNFVPRIDVLDESMYVNLIEVYDINQERQSNLDNLLMAYNDVNVMLKK
jgi:serine/threonine protein kinase